MDAKLMKELEDKLIENGSADFCESYQKYGYDILEYLFNIGKIRFKADQKPKSSVRIMPTDKLLKEE